MREGASWPSTLGCGVSFHHAGPLLHPTNTTRLACVHPIDVSRTVRPRAGTVRGPPKDRMDRRSFPVADASSTSSQFRGVSSSDPRRTTWRKAQERSESTCERRRRIVRFEHPLGPSTRGRRPTETTCCIVADVVASTEGSRASVRRWAETTKRSRNRCRCSSSEGARRTMRTSKRSTTASDRRESNQANVPDG